jgi:hypothetical protein
MMVVPTYDVDVAVTVSTQSVIHAFVVVAEVVVVVAVVVVAYVVEVAVVVDVAVVVVAYVVDVAVWVVVVVAVACAGPIAGTLVGTRTTSAAMIMPTMTKTLTASWLLKSTPSRCWV